ncbi:lipoprotein [Campylobacter coli]|nr:hypothetical protein cje4_09141 [Campylobacter jejuni subsp. jejuni 140-16]KRS67335.1 lipoprotein [Campylobacter coli]
MEVYNKTLKTKEMKIKSILWFINFTISPKMR